MSGFRDLFQAAMRRWWLVAFVIATLWVWQRYAVVQAGHSIAEHRATLADLVETRDALLAENTTLSSRVRIESIAATRLGLKPTQDSQLIRLSADRTDETQSVIQAGGIDGSSPKSESTPESATEAVSDQASP
jgi:cell division protein FtsL